MTDVFLEALKNIKNYGKFDLNFAVICSQLSMQSYNDPIQQISFLQSYGFTTIKILSNSNARGLLACYGDDLYIAIMGTDFSNTKDILNSADMIWAEEQIGYVHCGYKDHTDLLWNDIKAYVDNVPHKQIIVTGHSMGGACGQIINYRFPKSIGYHFASTRVVDKKIQTDNTSSVYHIQHRYDIIPNFPPSIFGFQLLGQVFVLQPDVLITKQPKWYNFLYSIFYTLAYFFMLGYTKCFGGQDHLSNMILTNHQIIGYCSNVESVAKLSLVANQ